jgi:hypothetical protein
MINYDKILNQLKIDIIRNDDLTNICNLTKDNAKISRRLGKSIEKNIINLVNSKEGIEKYKLWLQADDIQLKWSAALNLFPLFPNECLEVLTDCKNNCSDTLKKSSMNDVITNYQKGLNSNNIFIQRLKKIYKTDDLNFYDK